MAGKYGIQMRGSGRALMKDGGKVKRKPRTGQQKNSPTDVPRGMPSPKRPGPRATTPSPKRQRRSFPDLTGDGKVTRADVLKGRGVFKKGGSSNYHTTKDGRRVRKGLYYYMNRAKRLGKSKPGKGSVSDKALKRSAKTAKK
jgi:hypothetical protein